MQIKQRFYERKCFRRKVYCIKKPLQKVKVFLCITREVYCIPTKSPAEFLVGKSDLPIK